MITQCPCCGETIYCTYCNNWITGGAVSTECEGCGENLCTNCDVIIRGEHMCESCADDAVKEGE